MSTARPEGAVLTDSQALDEAIAENEKFRDQIYYLTEMGRLLGHLDLELLLVRILDLTTEFLGADVGSIALYNSRGEIETAVEWGLPHEVLLQLQRLDQRVVIDEVLESGEPAFLAREDLLAVEDGSYSADNLFILPLRTENQTLGCINMVATSEASFGPEWLETVGPGVGLAAIAVENAQLFQIKLEREREQQQLALAQEIQRGLLPRQAPDVPGLQLAADSVAAAVIGGDYYDYLSFPDGSTGVVVADVVGKGVPAGLVMAAVRAMFRTTSKQTSSPASILTRVNQQLCAEELNAVFVTAVCCRIDLKETTYTVASAGHDPLLLFRNGEAHFEAPGPACLPLGILGDQDYTEYALPLQRDDVLVFYTDGVTEAMNSRSEQFGAEGLRDLVQNGAGEDASALLKRILRGIAEHIGSHPRHDDTTLVVGRLAGEPVD